MLLLLNLFFALDGTFQDLIFNSLQLVLCRMMAIRHCNILRNEISISLNFYFTASFFFFFFFFFFHSFGLFRYNSIIDKQVCPLFLLLNLLPTLEVSC